MLTLVHASERLKIRYCAGEIGAVELDHLLGIALLHGDPMEEPRPGGIRPPFGIGNVAGEIVELGTPTTVVMP